MVSAKKLGWASLSIVSSLMSQQTICDLQTVELQAVSPFASCGPLRGDRASAIQSAVPHSHRHVDSPDALGVVAPARWKEDGIARLQHCFKGSCLLDQWEAVQVRLCWIYAGPPAQHVGVRVMVQ